VELDDLPDRLRKMIATISSDIGYLDLTSGLGAAKITNCSIR
jgi:hypothetical protein